MGSKSSQKSASSNASSSIGFGGDNAGIVGNGNSQTEDYSSTDNSMSYEDNIYLDTSSTDNSYTDNSMSYEDNSYLDTSVDGDYNGNSGTINLLDGGAIEMAGEALAQAAGLGRAALDSSNMAIAEAMTLGVESLDTANHAIDQNSLVSGNAMELMGKAADSSMMYSQMSNEIIRDTSMNALEQMSYVVDSMRQQAQSTVLSSTSANQKALETTAKLMTTVSSNGNDLLIDGVVNIAKYAALGLGSLGLVFGIVKLVGGKK